MSFKTISFIGAGNIAEAMIKGFVTSGILNPGDIMISDVNRDRLNLINKTYGSIIAENNIEAISKADLIFLTVKPWQLEEVIDSFSLKLKSDKFIVSVAAGKSLKIIKEHLKGHKRIVRIMPNLAVGVKKGTIGLYAEKDISSDDLNLVNKLLGAIGTVFRIENEKLMPVITALSGSAPAYYVFMAEALIKYGISQGLNEEIAVKTILSTMEGSAAWALNSKIDLSELWKKVVTKGGTTEEGINYYNEKKFIDIFVEGLDRATKKARSMGDE